MKSQLGRSLLVLVFLAGGCTLLAAFVFSQSPTAAESAISEATLDVALAQMRAGEPAVGAMTLLNILRGVPREAAGMDEALGPVQLLAFDLCALMSNDEIQTFLAQLDPADNPSDYLALIGFYHEWLDWESSRGISFMPRAEVWDWLRALASDESPLVRMGALLYLTREERDLSQPDQINAVAELVNGMAKECGSCRVTRESFRMLLKEALWQTTEKSNGATPISEPISAVLSGAPWNELMAAMIKEDPVVQSLQETMGTALSNAAPGDNALRAVLSAAVSVGSRHADPEVRSWFREVIGPCATSDKTPLSGDVDVKGAVAEMAAEESARDKVPLDVARVQYIRFWTSLESGMEGLTAADAGNLLNQRREWEPVEANYFEKIPREINGYAHRLINKGDYAAAAEVLRLLAEAYPNSELELRSRKTLAVLTPAIK